jgi:Tfp pilus assembly protein PilO
MGSLDAIRRRLELLQADIAALERMLPSDAEEVVDHINQARTSLNAALAVFKKRDRDIRETYGFKR